MPTGIPRVQITILRDPPGIFTWFTIAFSGCTIPVLRDCRYKAGRCPGYNSAKQKMRQTNPFCQYAASGCMTRTYVINGPRHEQPPAVLPYGVAAACPCRVLTGSLGFCVAAFQSVRRGPDGPGLPVYAAKPFGSDALIG